MNDLLTLAEVATMLRISKAHASKLVRGHVRGVTPLPAVRLGRRVIIEREQLFQWLSKNLPGSVRCD
jgi:excisionase family DNA binding protein